MCDGLLVFWWYKTLKLSIIMVSRHILMGKKVKNAKIVQKWSQKKQFPPPKNSSWYGYLATLDLVLWSIGALVWKYAQIIYNYGR